VYPIALETPAFEERLRQMGAWLAVNGEAIYASKAWFHQNDTVTKNIWYTAQKSPTNETIAYAIVLSWPDNNTLILGAPVTTPQTRVTMLGYAGSDSEFMWSVNGGNMTIKFPYIPVNKLPSVEAWVLKIEHLGNTVSSNSVRFDENPQKNSKRRMIDITGKSWQKL